MSDYDRIGGNVKKNTTAIATVELLSWPYSYKTWGWWGRLFRKISYTLGVVGYLALDWYNSMYRSKTLESPGATRRRQGVERAKTLVIFVNSIKTSRAIKYLAIDHSKK